MQPGQVVAASKNLTNATFNLAVLDRTLQASGPLNQQPALGWTPRPGRLARARPSAGPSFASSLRRLAALVLLRVGITFVAFVADALVPGDPAAANLGQQADRRPGGGRRVPPALRPRQAAARSSTASTSGTCCTATSAQSEQNHDAGRARPGAVHPGDRRARDRLDALRDRSSASRSAWSRRCAATGSPTTSLRVVSLGGRLDADVLARAGRPLRLLLPARLAARAPAGSTRRRAAAAPHRPVHGRRAASPGSGARSSDAFMHLMLPALVLAAYNVGLLTRYTRSAVLEVISNDYVRAARAKGLPERIVDHAPRAARGAAGDRHRDRAGVRERDDRRGARREHLLLAGDRPVRLPRARRRSTCRRSWASACSSRVVYIVAQLHRRRAVRRHRPADADLRERAAAPSPPPLAGSARRPRPRCARGATRWRSLGVRDRRRLDRDRDLRAADRAARPARPELHAVPARPAGATLRHRRARARRASAACSTARGSRSRSRCCWSASSLVDRRHARRDRRLLRRLRRRHRSCAPPTSSSPSRRSSWRWSSTAALGPGAAQRGARAGHRLAGPPTRASCAGSCCRSASPTTCSRARLLGSSARRALVRDVLPNVLGPVLVLATLDLGNAILLLSGLSFLGLGAQPPTPEWGAMVAEGTQYFQYWWIGTFPGLAIFTVVLAFNFLGDGAARRPRPAVVAVARERRRVTRAARGRGPPRPPADRRAARSRSSTASTTRSSRARCSASPARAAAARRSRCSRCCGCCPPARVSTARRCYDGRDLLALAAARAARRARQATSRWSSRTR